MLHVLNHKILPDSVEIFIVDWLLSSCLSSLFLERNTKTFIVFVFKYSLKVQLSTYGLQDISILLWKFIQT